MNIENKPSKNLETMSLHDITLELGSEGLIERFSLEVQKLPEEDQFRINQAFLSAERWHADQKRTNGPYIDHILRVALRVISHFGITDPDILIAAVLHDSVEDQAEKIGALAGIESASQEQALAVLGDLYGERVGSILKALTNPPGEISREEYDEHVRQALLAEPDAIPVKISDFIDNAAGIFWTIGDSKQLKLSLKYLPLVDFYRSIVTNDLYPFSQEAKSSILKHLDSAELRMRDVIKKIRQINPGGIAVQTV